MERFGQTLLRWWGWRIEGNPPNIRKVVIAVAPHTSNWDFVLGVLVMWAIDLKLSFFGKHTLFFWPFSLWMRSIGGIPVDRTTAHGLVGEAIDAYQSRDYLWLAIAPEGTRKKVERFKSGFMHIAIGAGVPVLLVTFDWGRRVVNFGPTIHPGPDVQAEVEKIEAFFRPIRGYKPK